MHKKYRYRFLFPLLLFVSTGLLLWGFFGNIIMNPGNFLYGTGDDSIKNYYTFIYYSLFDSGVHFSGMNYPFGEHVVFTDAQPIFSFLTNLLNRVVPLSALDVIGILNLNLLLGFMVGAFFLFLILRKNLLPVWFALIAANLIIFLSPQFMRIQNHYALSYMYIVPAAWYFLIRIFENRRTATWYIVYIVFCFLTGLIHPYHLTITAILTLAYTFVFLLQELPRFKSNVWFLIRLFFTAIIPVILFQLFLMLTDPVPDRPKTPWGFLVYRTSFESVFFPTEEPLKSFWREIFNTKEPMWEGYAYVGLAGLACLLLTFILASRYLLRRRYKLILRPVLPLPLRIGIWAATLSLLFAMGMPFTFGLEGMLEYLPPLKQFRSIGRFAWIFYYIFSVYIAFYFYRLFRYLSQRQARSFALSFLLVILLVWGTDARVNLHRKEMEMNRQDSAPGFFGNTGNYTEALALAHRDASEFQAILPLPFYLVGAEYYGFAPGTTSMHESMRASLNLHLPLATGMMSRTSYSQTLNFTQLLSSDLIRKEIIQKYPNQKPLLLLTTGEALTVPEQRILAKATRITSLGNNTLYELPLSAFRPNLQKKVTAFEANKTTFFEKNGIYASRENAAVVVKNFGGNASGPSLFDKGAAFTKTGSLNLYNAQLPGAQDSTTYEISVWQHLNPKFLLGELKIRLYDETGRFLEEKKQARREPTEIYKTWAKSTLEIKFHHASDRLEVIFEGEGLRADNLLIRPKDVDVYYYTAGGKKLILNNYQIK